MQAAPPPTARWLGFAGLVPQAAALAILLFGDGDLQSIALALGDAYAALILSFLGGMWWGIAAAARVPAPRWLWFAAVVPSLIALVSGMPWVAGHPRPTFSLALLGVPLLGSLVVDYKLSAAGLTPSWWLTLRVPLSIGLGFLTLLIAILA